jgi:LAO/AO transport system kinase
MLELTDLAHDAWRPPIIATVANDGSGVPEMWDQINAHRAVIEADGTLAKRREQRTRQELAEIVATRLGQRARELCSGDVWEQAASDVLARRLDPWGAADIMLDPVGA